MKKLKYFIVFAIFVSALPSKSEATALPRPVINHKAIQYFIHSPLQMRERNLKKEKYENTIVRKSNPHTIPIYLIMSPQSSQRTGSPGPTTIEYLFDDRGMIYITNPKAERYGQPSYPVLDNFRRGSHSKYDVFKKEQEELRSYVNQELNKQILKKSGMRRFMKNYDREYNFNDLVM